MSETKVILKVDLHMVETLSKLTGKSKSDVIYAFNDKAMELSAHIMKDDFKTNWSQKNFEMENVPFKLRVKAKYNGYQGRKIGDIICTFEVPKSNKWAEYNSQDLYNEMIEKTLQLRT